MSYFAHAYGPTRVDLDERRRDMYADAGPMSGFIQGQQQQTAQNQQQSTNTVLPGQTGGPTSFEYSPYGQGQSNPNSGQWNGAAPAYVAGNNAYQYGGYQGGAAAAEQGYAQAGQAALNQQAAQINNPYAAADRAAVTGNMGSEGSLAAMYANMAQGKGPNLAQAQLNQATDQSIQAQLAAARSGPGGALGAAGAARGAQMSGVQTQQANAQQAAIANIQQQQMAAQAAAGLYGQVGSQAGQLQQFSQGAAAQQAQLQEQQQALGAQTGLGYAGLGANVAQAQLGAQQNQQTANLQSAGLAQNQQQFNTNQNNQMIGTGLAAAGTALAFLDADFQEPRGPAHLTLREERSVDGKPFLAIADQQTGRVGKLAVDSLTPEEHHRVMEPHGAGPLFAPPGRRAAVVAHDLGLSADDNPYNIGAMAGGAAGQSASGIGAAAGKAAGAGAGTQASGYMASLPGKDEEERKRTNPLAGAAARATAGEMAPYQPPPMQMLPSPAMAQMYAPDLDLKRGRYSDAPLPDFGAIRQQLAATPVAAPAPAAGPAVTLNPGGQVFAPGAATPVLGSQLENIDTPVPGLPTKRDFDISRATAEQRAASREHEAVDPSTLVTVPRPAGSPGVGAATGAGTVPGMGAVGGGAPAKLSYQSKIRPEDMAGIKAGETEQIGALTDQQRAAEHQAEDASVAHALRADTLAKQGDELAAQEQKNDAEVERIRAAKEAASLDAKKAGEHFGYHPSAVTSMMHGIAAALGAAGASLTHSGQNYALETIQKSIDRDLERQKQEIESKKGRVSDLDSALATAYRRTGDMRQAMAIAHQNALQAVDERAASFAQSTASEKAKADYEALHGQLTEASARKDAELYHPVMTGGAGVGSNLAKEYQAYVKGELAKPGGKAMTYPEFYRAMSGAGGASLAERAGGAGGKISPRIQTKLADLDAQEKAAGELDALMANGSSFSPSDRARATALAEVLRKGGHESVPENPLEVFSSTTARRAGLGAVREETRRQRTALEERARNGGGAADEGEEREK